MPVSYNSAIKRPGLEEEYTEEQILELVKCSDNPEYFFEKYIKVLHPDKGYVNFNLYPHQKKMMVVVIHNRFSILKLFRQAGKTSWCAAYMLWYICFHDDKTCGIISNKETSAKEVLTRLKNMYELLPSWIKPGVKNYEQTFVIFENGSRVISSATSKNSFRGYSINGILLADEFAHVPKNLQQEFWSSNYPTISASKEAKIIIVSTPFGMYDLFHEIYSKAERGLNGFKALNCYWYEHPERDEKWLEEQRKVLGEKLFRQEICTEFIGSNDTVIEALTLERLMLINNKPIHLDLNGNFRIYEKPVLKAQYVLGVDTSKGVQKDFSVIQVIRIDGVNPIKLEQVAVYENNAIDVYAFAEVVNRIAVYYNQGYIMVENNAEGNTVVSELHWNYENSGLINEGTKTSTLGIRATKKTKPKAVLLMKRLIENEFIKINDRETIRQLTDFIETSNYVYRCDNLHDDLVSGLYWALWFLQMNILNDSVSYLEKKPDDDDAWGILAGTSSYTEDWSWL